MAKRKYTKIGERPKAYKCTKRKCGWEGTLQEQKQVPRKDDHSITEYVCPDCNNRDFHGLLEIPKPC